MDRSKMKWWDKFCALKRYSFMKNSLDSVCRFEDISGQWIEQYNVGLLINEMESEINRLESDNEALRRRLEMKFV